MIVKFENDYSLSSTIDLEAGGGIIINGEEETQHHQTSDRLIKTASYNIPGYGYSFPSRRSNEPSLVKRYTSSS